MLVLKNISKSFPGVKALTGVNLEIRRGEVHALVGGNGAGKSTLMKILSGAYKKDEGQIWIDGNEVDIGSPRESEKYGISIIYQELNLINSLTVAENIYLGRQPRSRGIVQWKKMNRDARDLLEHLNIAIDPRHYVWQLSIAQRQMVEIAKAVGMQSNILIMDEPTSSLSDRETQVLFSIIRKLKERQVSIIFITHRLEEVFDISDRVTVLRDGQYIATRNIDEINRDELITLMIGRELSQQYPERQVELGEIILQVENLSGTSRFHNVSFSLRRGEVLGFTGMVGAGRTELMRVLFGVDRKQSGTVVLAGRSIRRAKPRLSIRSKMGFVTEDRKIEGLALNLPVKHNISVVARWKIKRYGLINTNLEKHFAETYVKMLDIVTPSVNQDVLYLSGGNQQKTVLAKWLMSDAEVIIMDEPTRGIDVGAKYEIYEIINRLVGENRAVIIVSSEVEEVMGICDRIIVMSEGTISGEILRENFSQKLIAEYSVGGVS